MDATWVPWPWVSVASGSSVKFADSTIRPARSGWLASIPVSTTPMVTPRPVRPPAHASGAPISGTLSSRLTRTFRSSHTFSTARPSAPAAAEVCAAGPVVCAAGAAGAGGSPAVSASQKASTASVRTSRAAPSMLGSARTPSVAGKASAVRASVLAAGSPR